MARYRDYDYDQMKMLPIAYAKQILPGSFEHSLSYLIDHEPDLSAFDNHYHNDTNGRPAYDPRLLLKIVLLDIPRASPVAAKSSVSVERISSLWRSLPIYNPITAP